MSLVIKIDEQAENSAIGCERQSVEGKRVKACTPRSDWETVLREAGVGKAAIKSHASRTEL